MTPWTNDTICGGGNYHSENWKHRQAESGPYHCDQGHENLSHYGGWCVNCKREGHANLAWVEGTNPDGIPLRIQPYTNLPPLGPRPDPLADWLCSECNSRALKDDYLCGHCREAVLYS
jgi:hypothetical protein